MQLPVSDLLADFLGGFVADRRQEADEVFTPVVLGSPRAELVTQEGKLLVFVVPFPIRVLAVNDFGFLEIELQSAFRQTLNNGFAQTLSLFPRPAVYDRIVGIPREKAK
jgi:hypothetical protein